MKHERKQIYAPPIVEIVDVAIEQGFSISLSGLGGDSDDSEFGDPYYLMEEL